MSLKHYLFKVSLFLGTIQFQPARIFKAIACLPWYVRSFKKFHAQTSWPIIFDPKLLDRFEEGGNHGEYFWQDLWVAKKIIEAAPVKHIDVGSRLDGFIAHLACTRDVEVLDIRPIPICVERVLFHQVDLFHLPQQWENVADCVTCLHTLEHFGLGRYGDQINDEGWKLGLESLKKILTPGGTLWLSTPIGAERVCFNAHRIFNPQTIVEEAGQLGLELKSFAFLTRDKLSAGDLVESKDISKDIAFLACQKYALGIFKFQLL
jgi:hypothetical protein